MSAIISLHKHLIALDAVLFDLVKLALELSLALQTLLSPAYIDDFPIDILSIHFINCLGKQAEHQHVACTGGGHGKVMILQQYKIDRTLKLY